MRKKDPFFPAFDGLPLLSDTEFSGMGLFLLRISYLLICAIPLVMSMLDAIAGVASLALYLLGVGMLCVPLLLDVIRKFHALSAFLDSLIVLLSSFLLLWNQDYVSGVALLIFYHLSDLVLCLLLRNARKKCDEHTVRILSDRGIRYPKDASAESGDLVVSEGEIVGADCIVVSGEAVCSLCYLDASNGEFRVSVGDILLAGTVIMEGELHCKIQQKASDSAVLKAKHKVLRCLSRPSASCASLLRVSVYLQTAYLLFLLMNVTFFDLPIDVSVLAVCGVFFCFHFLLRFLRARDLFLLSLFFKKGILPESVDVVLRLFRKGVRQIFVRPETAFKRKTASPFSVFRVSSRMPRRGILFAELASEIPYFITASDVALMYRTREEILPLVDRCYETRVMTVLSFLLFVLSLSGAVLALVFTKSCMIALIILFVALFIIVLSFAVSFRRERTR